MVKNMYGRHVWTTVVPQSMNLVLICRPLGIVEVVWHYKLVVVFCLVVQQSLSGI